MEVHSQMDVACDLGYIEINQAKSCINKAKDNGEASEGGQLDRN